MKNMANNEACVKIMQEMLKLPPMRNSEELQNEIRSRMKEMNLFQRIILQYKLAKHLKKNSALVKEKGLRKGLRIFLSFLYGCLCILGFRLFMKYDMHIIWQLILVNVSTFWGIMAVRGIASVFKSNNKS